MSITIEPDGNQKPIAPITIDGITFTESFVCCPCCNHCYNCKKPSKKLSRCQRCKNAFYCGAECQKKHWKTHKSRCFDVEKRTVLKFRNLMNLGGCYYKHFRPKKAIKYLDMAIEVFEVLQKELEEKDPMGMMLICSFMSKVFLDKSKCHLYLATHNFLMKHVEEKNFDQTSVDSSQLTLTKDSIGGTVSIMRAQSMMLSHIFQGVGRNHPTLLQHDRIILECEYHQGKIHYIEGKYDQALKSLQKSLEYINGREKIWGVLKMYIYQLLCQVCIVDDNRNISLAMKYAEAGIRMFDQKRGGIAVLQNTKYLHPGNKMDRLKTLIKHKPYFCYFLGYVYYHMKMYRKSLSQFRKGLKIVEKAEYGTEKDHHLALILHWGVLVACRRLDGKIDPMRLMSRSMHEIQRIGVNPEHTMKNFRSFESLNLISEIKELKKDRSKELVFPPMKYVNVEIFEEVSQLDDIKW